MFKFINTPIKDLFVVEPQIFGDQRGYFFEFYKKEEFEKAGLLYDFVQNNQSKSNKGVLRGLHFQKSHPQAKLVRVIEGEVYDVAVDLRKNSETYGKHFGIALSGDNKKMFLIPRGFAHGFLVLSETAIFEYACDDSYHPEDEGGIIWNDPEIGIKWPLKENLILSAKDQKLPLLKDSKFSFDL